MPPLILRILRRLREGIDEYEEQQLARERTYRQAARKRAKLREQRNGKTAEKGGGKAKPQEDPGATDDEGPRKEQMEEGASVAGPVSEAQARGSRIEYLQAVMEQLTTRAKAMEGASGGTQLGDLAGGLAKSVEEIIEDMKHGKLAEAEKKMMHLLHGPDAPRGPDVSRGPDISHSLDAPPSEQWRRMGGSGGI
ncbi:hypothetical protein MMC13_005944 [Lambiella insularis]|nr:hypothetical protein [Lambiella insularis]